MNGFDATGHIRQFESQQQWAWTPIIFLTSSSTTENLVTAIEAGGDDLLPKNVPESVLRAKMKAMARVASLRHKLAAANATLEEQANLDGLTGLLNRRCMDRRTDQAWANACQAAGSFGVLMVDIDNFKRYNDHYGHQAGDDCLRQVAKAIEKAVRAGGIPGAFAARYGGEEFSVILPRVSQEAFDHQARAVVAAIRRCELVHQHNEAWGFVTASLGGAFSPVAIDRVGDLFREADKLLYQAKACGRNRAVTCHQPVHQACAA
jgi:diguanylate cyclase (GGDEF)-like protein